MKPILRNGWEIYYHPFFAQQFQELRQEVEKLQAKLSAPDVQTHPAVKLFIALVTGIEDKIPLNPLASHFALRNELRRFCRMKKMGLSDRYRLFFKVYKAEKVIVILWLGYPRREGDQKDCYKVFAKMVKQGKFPTDLNDLIFKGM